jgi:hypothetical protein
LRLDLGPISLDLYSSFSMAGVICSGFVSEP